MSGKLFMHKLYGKDTNPDHNYEYKYMISNPFMDFEE